MCVLVWLKKGHRCHILIVLAFCCGAVQLTNPLVAFQEIYKKINLKKLLWVLKKEEGHIIYEGLTIKDSFTKKGVGLQMRAHVCSFAPLKKGNYGAASVHHRDEMARSTRAARRPCQEEIWEPICWWKIRHLSIWSHKRVKPIFRSWGNKEINKSQLQALRFSFRPPSFQGRLWRDERGNTVGFFSAVSCLHSAVSFLLTKCLNCIDSPASSLVQRSAVMQVSRPTAHMEKHIH